MPEFPLHPPPTLPTAALALHQAMCPTIAAQHSSTPWCPPCLPPGPWPPECLCIGMLTHLQLAILHCAHPPAHRPSVTLSPIPPFHHPSAPHSPHSPPPRHHRRPCRWVVIDPAVSGGQRTIHIHIHHNAPARECWPELNPRTTVTLVALKG